MLDFLEDNWFVFMTSSFPKITNASCLVTTLRLRPDARARWSTLLWSAEGTHVGSTRSYIYNQGIAREVEQNRNERWNGVEHLIIAIVRLLQDKSLRDSIWINLKQTSFAIDNFKIELWRNRSKTKLQYPVTRQKGVSDCSVGWLLGQGGGGGREIIHLKKEPQTSAAHVRSVPSIGIMQAWATAPIRFCLFVQ